ncbi:S8 family peptidase, partial [Sporichthya sp.]|uniref:S8 family peptidase n=1 Tax=Sporichthya sp. TaxID=65475 RepID=UPI0017D3CCBC
SQAVRGFAASLPAAAVDDLRTNPDVRAVERDVRVSAAGGVESPAPWNLDRIDQRSLPVSNSFTYDGDGSGITVYVVDTGIRADHAELGGRVGPGFTAISDGNGTNDCNGHGTHVAGVTGGSTYGVAKGVTLVPVRVLDCDGTGSGTTAIAGLDWVLANRVPGKSVVNMSLGGPAAGFLDDAVNALINAGIPVVAAAGNASMDACATSPARVPNAVTVGATNSSDARPSFSNFGPCLDLFAPGVGIVSAGIGSPTSASSDGTSAAAPHVSGMIATLLQGAPGASPAALRTTLGTLLTQGVLANIGTGSPNSLLYAPPRLRLAGVGTATTGPFLTALGADPGALALGGTRQVDSFPITGASPIATQDPATVPGCTITRPASQAAGRSALLASLSAGNGCVQFAQAESLDLSPASPRLAYVPYSRENVTYAISVVSALPKNFTLAQLQTIYRCQGNPSYRPMLPAAGSGLREFWVAQMYPGGVLPSPPPACLQDGFDEFGVPIAPNAGGPVNNFEIVPVSVPQWTAQAAGVVTTDGRGVTRIGQIEGRSPFAGDFGLVRDLYAVIPASAVTGAALTDLRLRNVFVGSDSRLCLAVTGPIGLRYGFRPHPSCGSTSLQTP